MIIFPDIEIQNGQKNLDHSIRFYESFGFHEDTKLRLCIKDPDGNVIQLCCV